MAQEDILDRHSIYRPLLDLIGKSEGTDRGRGYDETLAYGLLTGGPVNLVRMSLDEVDGLQTRMLRHPANRWNSSACGRYQIVRTTLRDLRNRLHLPGTEKFDAALQDRLACFLLGRRGIDLYIAGKLGEADILRGLALEWASLPTQSGAGHYVGQKSAVSLDEVRAVLAEVRSRGRVFRAGWPKILSWLLALAPRWTRAT